MSGIVPIFHLKPGDMFTLAWGMRIRDHEPVPIRGFSRLDTCIAARHGKHRSLSGTEDDVVELLVLRDDVLLTYYFPITVEALVL